MAQWLTCRPPELGIPGSRPGAWFMFFLGAHSRRGGEEMWRRGDGAMGTFGREATRRARFGPIGQTPLDFSCWELWRETMGSGGRRKPNRTSGGRAEGCRDRPDEPTLSATLVALGPLSLFCPTFTKSCPSGARLAPGTPPPLPNGNTPPNESHLLASS